MVDAIDEADEDSDNIEDTGDDDDVPAGLRDKLDELFDQLLEAREKSDAASASTPQDPVAGLSDDENADETADCSPVDPTLRSLLDDLLGEETDSE